MARPALTIAASLAVGATVMACGLLTGVDWDRVVVADDGGSSSGTSGASSGASGGTSGASSGGASGGTSGTSGNPVEGGTRDSPCVPTATEVCLADGTMATKCSDTSCTGFGKCMTEPKSSLFNTCVPPDGSFSATCAAAGNVTSLAGPEPSGPVIWGAQLTRGKDCATTQRGYSLTFSFFDAEGDAPDNAFVGIEMDADFGFNNPPIHLTNGAIAFQGTRTAGTGFMFPCVNANPLPASAAFVLIDAQGHRSNPLCLTITP